MLEKWEIREGKKELEENEKARIRLDKAKVIEIVHGVKLRLFGDCHDRVCRGRYDLTDDFFSRKNGAASFSKNCFTVDPAARGPKRVNPIFDGRLCWQELKYRIEGEDSHGMRIEGQFWKVKQLREKILQYIGWKSEKIREIHPDIFYSVILNYGNLTEAFRDIGQKYKIKWTNYDEIIEKLVAADLSDYFIGWITGSCIGKIERRKKSKKTT